MMKRKLTKRGKAVVAIAYVLVSIAIGVAAGEVIIDGLEKEGVIRDSQTSAFVSQQRK